MFGHSFGFTMHGIDFNELEGSYVEQMTAASLTSFCFRDQCNDIKFM